MKVEKISENQVKFTLSQTDLVERDIKLSDLVLGSGKTQELFHEMMEAAMMEFGFSMESNPLMIEAMPMSSDTIMIIVTKVENNDELDGKLKFLPTENKFNKVRRKKATEKEEIKSDENLSIFSFDSLDFAADASSRLYRHFDGTSQLYKSDGRYFLVLENNDSDEKAKLADIDLLLGEYGQKHISTLMSKYYLAEHGELLIADKAIDILAQSLCYMNQ